MIRRAALIVAGALAACAGYAVGATGALLYKVRKVTR